MIFYTNYKELSLLDKKKCEKFLNAKKMLYLCTQFEFNIKNKMTKADIINKISESTGVQKKDVAVTVEAFMEAVKDCMCDKENVYLRGFGTFQIKHRAEKTARNISKNTTLTIAAHDFPGFKPSKSFIQRMKGEAVTAED